MTWPKLCECELDVLPDFGVYLISLAAAGWNVSGEHIWRAMDPIAEAAPAPAPRSQGLIWDTGVK